MAATAAPVDNGISWVEEFVQRGVIKHPSLIDPGLPTLVRDELLDLHRFEHARTKKDFIGQFVRADALRAIPSSPLLVLEEALSPYIAMLFGGVGVVELIDVQFTSWGRFGLETGGHLIPHADTIKPYTDGSDYREYDLIVCVPVNKQRSGKAALKVWPGGHTKIAKFFADGFSDGKTVMDLACLLTESRTPGFMSAFLKEIEPSSLIGDAGDVFFMNRLLPHQAAAENYLGVAERLYFRYYLKDGTVGAKAFPNPWINYRGLSQ